MNKIGISKIIMNANYICFNFFFKMQQKNLPMNGLENILNFIAENCFELAQDLDKNTLLFALKHLRKQNMQEYFVINNLKER